MANADGKNSLKCQLCEKWVAKDNWTIKGHRGKCASDNTGLLITFDKTGCLNFLSTLTTNVFEFLVLTILPSKVLLLIMLSSSD